LRNERRFAGWLVMLLLLSMVLPFSEARYADCQSSRWCTRCSVGWWSGINFQLAQP